MKKIILFMLVAGAAVLIYGMGSIQQPAGSASENKSAAKAYNFNLKEIGSPQRRSLEDFRGKPVFIDFWASWCPPCRSAIPYVEKLYDKYEGRISVIGINLDRDISKAAAFIDSRGMRYIQLSGTGSPAPSEYGVRGIPAFFIIDKNGNIIERYTGFRSGYYDEWVRVLEKLIQ